MQFLHDVWVNWFEGEENGYNVCAFHEWRKDDALELLDQVPVITVNEALYWQIENDMQELPKSLMEHVHEKAYMRKNHERICLEYCFIVTDGVGILAVDTIGYNIPVRKSRLIPRQEQLVYEMTASSSPVFEITTLEMKKEHHCLSPAPDTMYGLTRRERQMKQIMYMALDKIRTENNVSQLRYWFTEWNPNAYTVVQTLSFETLWSMLLNELAVGWSEAHQLFTGKLVKRETYLERLWEIEQEQKVN
ncbi:MAG: DUF3603 family protein [Bacilli bacterium]